MKMAVVMRKLARWHIWLGWLVGVPLILWTLSGLVMVARPIDEVHGDYLRIEAAQQPLALPGDGHLAQRASGEGIHDQWMDRAVF